MVLFLITAGAVAALVPAAIAFMVRRLTKRDVTAIVVGGLMLPALVLAGLLYWLATMEVDDADPGMVILGNLLLVAVITPVGMLASYLTVRFLARRKQRHGR